MPILSEAKNLASRLHGQPGHDAGGVKQRIDSGHIFPSPRPSPTRGEGGREGSWPVSCPPLFVIPAAPTCHSRRQLAGIQGLFLCSVVEASPEGRASPGPSDTSHPGLGFPMNNGGNDSVRNGGNDNV